MKLHPTTWNQLTALEQAVYRCMPLSGHLFDAYDADEFRSDCGTWVDVKSWAAWIGCSPNQVKGVLSSLIKKRLVVVTDYDETDTWLSFTPEGYALLSSVI